MRVPRLHIRTIMIAVAVVEVGVWMAMHLMHLIPRGGAVGLVVLPFAHLGFLFITYMVFYSALNTMRIRLTPETHLVAVAILSILIFKATLAMIAVP